MGRPNRAISPRIRSCITATVAFSAHLGYRMAQRAHSSVSPEAGAILHATNQSECGPRYFMIVKGTAPEAAVKTAHDAMVEVFKARGAAV